MELNNCKAWVRPGVLVALSLGLAGCSSIKPYSSTHEPNVTVRANTDTGVPLISKREAGLNIYALNAACETEYLGTVNLDGRPTVDLGLPTGRPLVLSFVFTKSSVFGSYSALLEMTVTPAKGTRYEFDVTHLDSYGAVGREFTTGNRNGREIEHKRAIDCVPKPV